MIQILPKHESKVNNLYNFPFILYKEMNEMQCFCV